MIGRPRLPIAERLPKFIERGAPDTDCWTWLGELDKDGYGTIRIGKKHHRVPRLVYELERGPIAPGQQLDHLCRVRHCVNPDHLEQVSQAENLRRGFACITHCPSGHPYDEANTYVTPAGARQCRTCKRVHARNSARRCKARAL